MRNGFVSIGLIAQLALGVSCGAANAASKSTQTEVSIPSVIALYCMEHIYIPLEQINTVEESPETGLNQTAIATVGEWEVTGPPPAHNVTNTTGIRWIYKYTKVTIEDVCAYRAVTGSAGVNVSIVGLNPVLEGPNGSSFTMSAFTVREASSGNSWSQAYNADSGGITEVRGIDAQMSMTASNSLSYGTYSSAADGTFSITVIANP